MLTHEVHHFSTFTIHYLPKPSQENEDTLLCQLNGLSVALHPISFSELGFPFYLAIPNVGKCCVVVSFLDEMMQNFNWQKNH
jgi:hypothetical protein